MSNLRSKYNFEEFHSVIQFSYRFHELISNRQMKYEKQLCKLKFIFHILLGIRVLYYFINRFKY